MDDVSLATHDSAQTVHRLSLQDYAAMFGVSEPEIPLHCRALIEAFALEYQSLSFAEHNQVVLDVLKRLHSGQLSVSGEARQEDWEKGWQENLDQYIQSGHDHSALIPKCIRPHPILRYNQRYIQAVSKTMEWKYFQIARSWLFETFLADVDSIYEFGCGPGFNFVALSELFPAKKLYGLDWAQSAVDLVNTLAESQGFSLEGKRFDFFAPDHEMRIDPNSGVVTIGALEQVGERFQPFLDFLRKRQPTVCVHIEPVLEWYDESNLVDYLAVQYHKARGYLNGFPGYLKTLEQEGAIEIVWQKRAKFGSLFHEGYSFIAWRPKR